MHSNKSSSYFDPAIVKKIFSVSKRSQTTTFIIIAIAIVALIFIVYFLNQSTKESNLQKTFSQLGISIEVSSVQLSLLDCIEESARASLDVIGIQGGYYNKPEKFFDLGWAFIPYYYDGSYLMPETAKIEQELAVYLDENLKFCINDLSYDEFTVNYKDSKTTAMIKEKGVSFETQADVTFKKSGLSSEFELEKYPVEIESALSDILEVADYITESHKEDRDFICVSCVADMAEERNLYVDMLDFGDETTTLIVISENYTHSEPYIFEFLNRYSEVVEEV